MQCLVEKLQHQVVDFTAACGKKKTDWILFVPCLCWWFLKKFKSLKIACHFRTNKNLNCQVVFLVYQVECLIEFVNIMKQWLFKLGLWSFGLSIRKQRDSFWSRASSRLCCINKESNDFFQRITSLLWKTNENACEFRAVLYLSNFAESDI